jgi:hypothetical protein
LEKKAQQNKVTDKTKEQLLAAKYETLTMMEKILQGTMNQNKDLSLEEAIESLEMIPF